MSEGGEVDFSFFSSVIYEYAYDCIRFIFSKNNPVSSAICFSSKIIQKNFILAFYLNSPTFLCHKSNTHNDNDSNNTGNNADNIFFGNEYPN